MDEELTLAQLVSDGLNSTFSMYLTAHTAQWNVTGPHFSEIGELFGLIADDLYASVNEWGTTMRVLGVPVKMEQHSLLGGPQPEMGTRIMVRGLYHENRNLLESLRVTVNVARADGQHGTELFLAKRVRAHEKWGWQLQQWAGVLDEPTPITPDDNRLDVAHAIVEGPGLEVVEEHYDKFDVDVVYFGDETEAELAEVISEHNAKAPSLLKADELSVRAVYRRGALTAGAHTSRHEGGMARVDAFLRLITAGRPRNPAYTADNDLLPVTHPRARATEPALVASAVSSALAVTPVDDDPLRPEDFILAVTEMSGLGYATEPAFRAAWIRAVNDAQDPKARVLALATEKYDSVDADLLPAL